MEEETYIGYQPYMVIGNLMFESKRYIEGTGNRTITNETLGITCDIHFMKRSWTNNTNTNRIEASIKDKDGNEKYTLSGYYTSEVYATDSETGETFMVFKAPEHLENRKSYYNMN